MPAAVINPQEDPAPLLAQALQQWGGETDLWVFGYASLIWRPEFEFAEARVASVHGYHRALKMYSHINRGTPECPGLVFALLPGGSCCGVAYRVASEQGAAVLERLWLREMVNLVYSPRWLRCRSPQGDVQALAFTLSSQHPRHTGQLDDATLLDILACSQGRYGSTLDYAVETDRALRSHGIQDRALQGILALAQKAGLIGTPG